MRCTSMSGDDGESGVRCALDTPHPGVLHTDNAPMFKATWGEFLRTGRLYWRGSEIVRVVGRNSPSGYYKTDYQDGRPGPNVRFGDEAGWELLQG